MHAETPPVSPLRKGRQGGWGVPSPWLRFRPVTALPTPWPEAALSWSPAGRGWCISPCRWCWANIHWGRWSRAKCLTTSRTTGSRHVARHLGLSPAPAWQAARLEHPVKRATLEMYADLLATLGQTFLETHYHTIMAAERRGQEHKRKPTRAAPGSSNRSCRHGKKTAPDWTSRRHRPIPHVVAPWAACGGRGTSA